MGGATAVAGNRAAHAAFAGRIGPNAIIRLAEALRERFGAGPTAEIFASAGHIASLREPPRGMVDERIVSDLHASLRSSLAPAEAAQVSARAGQLTADYLLANRIPRPVRVLLTVSPAPWAARVLVGAIGRHAWTFAGSGVFAAQFGSERASYRLRLSVAGCPLCRGARCAAPTCDYYAATFERLFRALVKSTACVEESACAATGAQACVFDVRW